ncbi:hypothetical protein [Paraburkholderia youngii]|uniref:hypothetical protein n=1 Tax=Paraburkholderia youngii TaxID=2782701 RepID=UPI003D24E28B
MAKPARQSNFHARRCETVLGEGDAASDEEAQKEEKGSPQKRQKGHVVGKSEA